MRRFILLAMVAAMLSLSLTATATSTERIKDKFTSIGWGGSDGSLPWAQNWVEIGDDGDEKFGEVRVVASGNCASGNCMRIMKGLIDSSIGARREADVTMLEQISLCYDLKNIDAGLDLGLVHLLVQVKGPADWVTIADYDLGDTFSGHYTHEFLDEFRSDDFQVRFLVTGPLLPSEVYIDTVEIQGKLIEDDGDGGTTTTTVNPTTTTTVAVTTTTKPAATTTTQPRGATTTTGAEATTSSTSPLGDPTPPTLAAPDRDIDTAGSSSPTSTTSTIPSGSGGVDGGDPGVGPDGSGIRAATRGLQASFQGDLYGELRTVSSLNGVDLQADYNMAVEIIKASWAWVVLLALLIAWAIVSGLDRRREDFDD